ncbi:hypothetical protein ABID42_000009 [Arcicella rosea]
MSKYLFYKMIGIITLYFSFYISFDSGLGELTEVDVLEFFKKDWNQVKDVKHYDFRIITFFTFLITLYLIRIIIVISIFRRLNHSIKIAFILITILNFIANNLLWSLRMEIFRALGRIYLPLILLIFVWIVLSFKFTKEE